MDGHYLDYCFKYNYNQIDKESIKLFIGKLKERKQSNKKLKQAFQAVSLCYELGLIDFEKDSLLKDKNRNLSTIKMTWTFLPPKKALNFSAVSLSFIPRVSR